MLFFGTAWAHTRSTCEIPLIGKFTGLVDLGLSRGWIPIERLAIAANSEAPVNPLADVDLDSSQYPLYQGFQSLMPEAKTHWDQIRGELRTRTQTETENYERVEKAAEKTRTVLHPQILSQFAASDDLKKIAWQFKNDLPTLTLDTGRRARKAEIDASGVFSILEFGEKKSDVDALNMAVKKWRAQKKEAPQDTLSLEVFEQGAGKNLTKIIVRTSTSSPPMTTKSMMETRRGGGFSNPYGMVMSAHDMICLKESVEIFSQRQGVLRREAYYDVGNACDAETSRCLVRKNGHLACVIATGGRATYAERANDGTWSAPSYIDGPSVFDRIALHETAEGEIVLAVSRTKDVSVYRPQLSSDPVQTFQESAAALSWFERRGQVYLAVFRNDEKSFIAEPLSSGHRHPVAIPLRGLRGRPATITLPDGRQLLAVRTDDQIFVLDLFTSMN